MNPLTNVRNITKLNEREIKLGISEDASWHAEYKDSAWIYIGGLDFGFTEGDIITVFSQYGEIVNINLVRDAKTGKSKGFCFLCYEDQRSTNLAVDNLNGIKLCNRTIRVDHVANYRMPKDDAKADMDTRQLREEGCAPNVHLMKEKNAVPTDERKHTEGVTVKKERSDRGYDRYDLAKMSHQRKEDGARDKFDPSRRSHKDRVSRDDTNVSERDRRGNTEQISHDEMHDRHSEHSLKHKSNRVRSSRSRSSTSSDSERRDEHVRQKQKTRASLKDASQKRNRHKYDSSSKSMPPMTDTGEKQRKTHRRNRSDSSSGSERHSRKRTSCSRHTR